MAGLKGKPCPDCGHHLNHEQPFCDQCGAKIDWLEETFEQPPTVTMRHGTLNCSCGQHFYFESVADKIACIKCGTAHDISGFPFKTTEVEYEDYPTGEGDQNGTNI